MPYTTSSNRSREQLRKQLKSDITYSRNDIPKELRKELITDVRKQPWIFALHGYRRALKMRYPELDKDIDSIFAGQLALGRMLKWDD